MTQRSTGYLWTTKHYLPISYYHTEMHLLPFLILLIQHPVFTVSDPFLYLGCYAKDTTPVTPVRSGQQLEVTGSVEAVRPRDLWFNPSVGQERQAIPKACITACRHQSFRYAGLSSGGDDGCRCGSSYGSTGPGQCHACDTNRVLDQEYCGDANSWGIYDTAFKVPSAPDKVTLIQRGENTLKISWTKPVASNGPLTGYQVSAHPLFTFAQSPLHMKSWRLSDLEDDLQLTGLLPATKYNISVVAINSEGQSSPTSLTLWSKIGIPETPPPPIILDSASRRMTIEMAPLRNTKGPLSKYRIVMVDESRLFQTRYFTMDRVATWNDSMTTGYPKYVAAQFLAEEFPSSGKFVIGDGRVYDGFFNGPIPEGHWHPSLGILSTLNNLTEISYSATSHDQHDNESQDILTPQGLPSPSTTASHSQGSSGRRGLKAKKPFSVGDSSEVVVVREMSPMIAALWISIAVTAAILFICISIYSVLKFDLLPKRHRRPSLAQPLSRAYQLERPTELTTCGANPAYIFPDDFSGGYTHSGFVPDEDLKSRAVDRCKHIWNVPRNLILIPSDDVEEGVDLIGHGRYGAVHLSQLMAKDVVNQVLIYTVPGKLLKHQGKMGLEEEREKFMAHLEELVRIEGHENVVKLLGFMEDGPSLLFVVEFGGLSLKEWLLDLRQSDSSHKMSPTLPYNLLICAMNIAEAMFHLHSYKITHGELAASNVLVPSLQVPKVTGFGLLKCDSPREGMRRDFSRWCSAEQFQNRCIKPCDLWSFGILLWELASLGATPYHDVRSEDLQKRLHRGLRPGQLEVIGDPLYQIMLHCWQLDREERPDFATLSCSLHQLLSNAKESLTISTSFNYPPRIHPFEYST